MRTLIVTGATGLLCAMVMSACSDASRSLLPTSPSTVSAPANGLSVSSSTMGNGHGNGNGNGGGNGSGNPSGNGGGNGNGNPNGNGAGTPPSQQSPAPTAAKHVELEGLISAIAGNVLTVNSQDVVVPAGVVVHHGSHVVDFADLVVGDRVHVRASLVNGVLTASDVKLQNPGDEEESGDPTNGTPLTVDGFVSQLSWTACPNKTFTVGTQPVQTNSTTVFSGGTCNVIFDGGHVIVNGVVQSGVLVAATVQIF